MTISTSTHQLETLVLTLIALVVELQGFHLVNPTLYTNHFDSFYIWKIMQRAYCSRGFICASLYLNAT
jgi:hypothetical protein